MVIGFHETRELDVTITAKYLINKTLESILGSKTNADGKMKVINFRKINTPTKYADVVSKQILNNEALRTFGQVLVLDNYIKVITDVDILVTELEEALKACKGDKTVVYYTIDPDTHKYAINVEITKFTSRMFSIYRETFSEGDSLKEFFKLLKLGYDSNQNLVSCFYKLMAGITSLLTYVNADVRINNIIDLVKGLTPNITDANVIINNDDIVLVVDRKFNDNDKYKYDRVESIKLVFPTDSSVKETVSSKDFPITLQNILSANLLPYHAAEVPPVLVGSIYELILSKAITAN